MDIMFYVISWLKGIIEKLKNITSFIDKDYLPDTEEGSGDSEFPFFGIFGKYNKKY